MQRVVWRMKLELELSWTSFVAVELTVIRLEYSVVTQQEQDCSTVVLQKAELRHINSMDQ